MNRVWTYIISKPLSATELLQLKDAGNQFVKGWTAHEQQLTASFDVYKDRIIVVKVNEDVAGASGCSIDKLLRFVKDSEKNLDIELLNRFFVALKHNDTVEIIHATKIKDLLAAGSINAQSVVLNTAAANEEELAHWEQPLKDTWLTKYL